MSDPHMGCAPHAAHAVAVFALTVRYAICLALAAAAIWALGRWLP